jgi:two-component system, OmpR family, response regulator
VALVIEDDEDASNLLVHVLTQAGFSVVTADNGVDGIALALEHQPVLATVDVSMPQMDGLEATRRIREVSHTYIVIVSSRGNEDDILAGFEAGADDYVPKPIRPRELTARLSAVARRPPTAVVGGPTTPPAWEAADADRERAAFLPDADTEDSGDPGEQDGEEGMLALGMRFVGSWIEFNGLRINPARGLVVIDDLLVDLPPEDLDLLEVLLYCGTRTLTGRQIALRLRKETEILASQPSAKDQIWVDKILTGLRYRLGDTGATPRWFESVPPNMYRLVRPPDFPS